MSSNVHYLRPPDHILEAAWEAYVAAFRKAQDDVLNRDSTSTERYHSATEAARLHAEFTKLFKRRCS